MKIRRLATGDEELMRRVVEEVKFITDNVTDFVIDPSCLTIFLNDNDNYLITALVDDSPVGFALGYLLRRIDRPQPMMFFYEVGVLEEYRKQGIGRALVEELKRFAQANGCCKMFVPTSASNTAAMALYRSAGGDGGAQLDAAAFQWYW